MLAHIGRRLAGLLLVLFIVFPVSKALYGAFLTEDGVWSVTAIYERIGNERVWGLACLAGGGRCGFQPASAGRTAGSQRWLWLAAQPLRGQAAHARACSSTSG